MPPTSHKKWVIISKFKIILIIGLVFCGCLDYIADTFSNMARSISDETMASDKRVAGLMNDTIYLTVFLWLFLHDVLLDGDGNKISINQSTYFLYVNPTRKQTVCINTYPIFTYIRNILGITFFWNLVFHSVHHIDHLMMLASVVTTKNL